ncbi:MAG: 4Fe-4S double cluster binding domain-containing protein [Thermodesulfobacteriota bacterium]
MARTKERPATAQAVKQAARRFGASLARVADLGLLAGIETEPSNLLAGFTRAVSVAVRLSDAVIETVQDRPTPLYAQHYLRVNALLDEIGVRLANWLEERGARALPLPASQALDRERMTSFLSHKAVAVAAGIGWQGKSLLTVSPQHGPRIRLATILTDADLKPDSRLKNRCGACTACADACPAQAIKGVNTDWHYADRDEALHFERCKAKVTDEFAPLPHVGRPICGVCIRVCPWGQGRGKRRAA